MSDVDEARERLIQLQIEQDEAKAQVEADRRQFEDSVKSISLGERIIQQRQADIREAKAQLARAENLAAAREVADEVEEGVERLREKFERLAEGHIWFEGTGNDDAVLSHQWQGMMFGAVARRWILGDGVGLGKTRTCVGWLDLIHARKVIVVCEANICAQFAGEIMELAPHRDLLNLAKTKGKQSGGVKLSPKEMRHRLLDEALSKDEGIIVVNFEIWRNDKDVLAKLMGWQADTLIVDEAHNLKTTSTANFGYIKMLLAVDNTCPNCKGHIYGLFEPEALKRKPSTKIAMPCAHCGWKFGDSTPVRYRNKLDELLSTRSIKNVCFTTGTPILNSPLDLYSLLHLVNPVLFTTKQAFQTTYLTNNYHSGKWEFRDGALSNLKPLIEGMFLARTLEDTGVVLPEQHHHMISVPLDMMEYPKQYTAIKQLTEAAQLVLDSGQAMTVMHLIALITRKRQANVWPGGIVMKDTDPESPTYEEIIFDAGEIDESVKMDAITEKIVEMHEQGRRQIVFSQFKGALAEFEVRLNAMGIRAVRFDGDTPEKLRLEVKRNFDRKYNEPAKWDVVLANYKTGGTGLNFTAATVSHEMDEEWNPGKRNQSRGRTKRMGQIEETDVFTYRIPKTIDTWMANTIARKESMIEGFNETMMDQEEPELAQSLAEAMRTGEML